MRRHNESTLVLARALASHPAVERVNYPGLEAHPDHARAAELFGGFSGMLSFEPVGGLKASRAVTSRLEIPVFAPSLGGVETLVTRPAETSHRGVPPDERAAIGIRDSLIRVSVGIEDVDDLVEDFTRALAG